MCVGGDVHLCIFSAKPIVDALRTMRRRRCAPENETGQAACGQTIPIRSAQTKESR